MISSAYDTGKCSRLVGSIAGKNVILFSNSKYASPTLLCRFIIFPTSIQYILLIKEVKLLVSVQSLQ